MNKKSKLLKSKIIFSGKWLNLQEDHIIKPDGLKASYEIVERRDAVIIIAEKNEKIFMVSQFRYAINENSLEFPQGFIESGEEPDNAARRELEEETGHKSDSLISLGALWVTTGFLRQKVHIFTTSSFKKGVLNRDTTESDMKVIKLSLLEIEEKVKKGEIKNSPTIAALGLFLLNRGKL